MCQKSSSAAAEGKACDAAGKNPFFGSLLLWKWPNKYIGSSCWYRSASHIHHLWLRCSHQAKPSSIRAIYLMWIMLFIITIANIYWFHSKEQRIRTNSFRMENSNEFFNRASLAWATYGRMEILGNAFLQYSSSRHLSWEQTNFLIVFLLPLPPSAL